MNNSEQLNIDNIEFDNTEMELDSKSNDDSNNNDIITNEDKKTTTISSRCDTNEEKIKKRCVTDGTYFWEPINESWQLKLGSDKFMIKNCLGDGNCQFRSIESALTNAGYKTTHERLRKRLAKYIMSMEPKMFINMIKSYQIELKNGEFVGKWDPTSIKNKRDFIKVVKSSGFDFQGDFITLELLSKAIGIDIIIFNNRIISDDKKALDIINLSNSENLQEKIIILYYTIDKEKIGHYQTIGLKGKGEYIKTIFPRSKLPEEIVRILDKKTLIWFHVNDICKSGVCGVSKIHLNYILNTLQSRLGLILSRDDRLSVMKIIQDTYLIK